MQWRVASQHKKHDTAITFFELIARQVVFPGLVWSSFSIPKGATMDCNQSKMVCKLQKLQQSTRSEIERFRHYGSAREVLVNFKRDLTSSKARQIHRDLQTVARLGEEIMLRNALPLGSDPPAELPVEGRAMVEAQAPKRVGLEFVERHRASFDHRKLGGVY